MKTITQKQLEKILISIIPQGNYDWKDIEVKPATYGGVGSNIFQIDAISHCSEDVAKEFNQPIKRDVWFYFYKKNNNWVVDLDGATAYDYLSTDAEFGQMESMVNKLDDELSKLNVHREWCNHYSFGIYN